MSQKLPPGTAVWLPNASLVDCLPAASVPQQDWDVLGITQDNSHKMAFWPASVVRYQDGNVGSFALGWQEYVEGDTQRMVVSADKLEVLHLRVPEDNIIPESLSELRQLNDASVLHVLGKRYRLCLFATRAGSSSVWMNPMNSLVEKRGNYMNDPRAMQEAFEGTDVGSSNGTIYSQIESVRRTLADRLNPQTIIFHGMSGSGKSEALKATVQYLLYADARLRNEPQPQLPRVSGSYAPLGSAKNPFLISNDAGSISRLAKGTIASIVLLDAMGTAQTEKNDTSSRHVKHMTVVFGTDRTIAGVTVRALLLDNSRFSYKSNFLRPLKIFPMLIAGLDRQILEDSKIVSSCRSAVLGKGSDTDALRDEFLYLRDTLRSVGLTEADWDDVVKCLLICLHLQTINVVGAGSSLISAGSKNDVSISEELLGWAEGSLSNMILKKHIENTSTGVGATSKFGAVSTDNNPMESKVIINALTTEVYQRTLSFLLGICNRRSSGSSGSSQSGTTLDVMDLPGYEVLESGPGGLAQLCANYAHEKFRALFVDCCFVREMNKYLSENVQIDEIVTPQFLPFIELFEKPPLGLISTMEEVCVSARADDKAFVDKTLSAFGKTGFVLSSTNKAKVTQFSIVHSFGDTLYDAEGFIGCNKGTPSNVLTLLQSSRIPWLACEEESTEMSSSAQAPASDDSSEPRIKSIVDKTKILKSLALTRSKAVLSNLQTVANSTSITYILCIRPAENLRTSTFEFSLCASQIGNLSIPSLALFHRSGYPSCQSYREFYDRYRVAMPFHHPELPVLPTSGVDQHLCSKLLQLSLVAACIPEVDTNDELKPKFGRSSIFMKKGLVDVLEDFRSAVLSKYRKATLLMQAVCRTKVARSIFLRQKRGVVKLQSLARMIPKLKSWKVTRLSAEKIKGIYLTRKKNRQYLEMKGAANLLKSTFLGEMVQRVRYHRLKRSLRSFHGLARGLIIHHSVDDLIKKVIVIQTLCRKFLKYFAIMRVRNAAAISLQRIFRGFMSRDENHGIVKTLLKKRKQRIAFRVVKTIQSFWRRKLVLRRKRQIIRAVCVVQHWCRGRRERLIYLKKKFLIRWLQCAARRKVAKNRTNSLLAILMMQQEAIELAGLRDEELQRISDRGPLELRVGVGLIKHGRTRVGRHVIAFDVFFDISEAYPQGWLATIMEFADRLWCSETKGLSKIAVGSQHTVLVDDSSNVYTFGFGDGGQLGHGTRKNLALPALMETLAQAAKRFEPSSPSLGKDSVRAGPKTAFIVREVCCGREHTMVLSESGYIWSWGSNRRGQLGHSNFESSSVPRLVTEGSKPMKNVKQISCGGYHAACVCERGTIYTWGAAECLGRASAVQASSQAFRDTALSNVQQHISSVTSSPLASSAKVSKDSSEAGSVLFFNAASHGRMPIQTVVCGDSHVAVKCAGTTKNLKTGVELFAWGNNSFGQLGAVLSSPAYSVQ